MRSGCGWLKRRGWLKRCGFYDKDIVPTPLHIDNHACIEMGQMPQFTEKQKHIPIRICHLKECCDDGMVELRPVSTANQLADIGTKALPQAAFNRLKEVIAGRMSFSSINNTGICDIELGA